MHDWMPYSVPYCQCLEYSGCSMNICSMTEWKCLFRRELQQCGTSCRGLQWGTLWHESQRSCQGDHKFTGFFRWRLLLTWEYRGHCTCVRVYGLLLTGNPLQYSCLENSMGRGAWWATAHKDAESDMTEHTCPTLQTYTYVYMHVCSYMHTQLCLLLCDPMDCSLPGSSVHGIIPSKQASQPGNLLHGRWILYHYICIYLFIYAYIYIHTHTHTHTHTSVYINIYIYILCIYTNVCIFVCI